MLHWCFVSLASMPIPLTGVTRNNVVNLVVPTGMIVYHTRQLMQQATDAQFSKHHKMEHEQ